MAAILKMVISVYLSRISPDFCEIRYADANLDSKNGHVTKNLNFRVSKQRSDAMLKIVFRLYLSAAFLD